MATIHATTVALGGRGVLICGAAGCGKSDLALRLIEAGAILVSDDYTEVGVVGDNLVAQAPGTIQGKMEVRGLGIVDMEYAPSAPVYLQVELVDRSAVERLPDRRVAVIEGVEIPEIRICGFDASAPAKVRLAVSSVRPGDAA